MVQENANEMNSSGVLQDTAEPTSTIEKLPAPADDFDEQEIDPAEINPAELAQEAAMDSGYFDGQIPGEITAPAGLSPKRAELARFMEWRRRTVAELEPLEEAHHRAVEALGGERTTKKKIDALIEADVGEVLKFALGGEAITATKLRAFERHQLEQKLKADKHAAQIASETLGQIEYQIAVKTLGLRFLDNRFQRYVRSAVVEAARESVSASVTCRRLANFARCCWNCLASTPSSERMTGLAAPVMPNWRSNSLTLAYRSSPAKT